jgi:predicted dehydrogenase
MLKLGVIGVGYLGQHHARIYSQTQGVELVGVVDQNIGAAQSIADKYGGKAFLSYDALLEQVDAVSVAAPTIFHHSIAMKALAQNKDVLVEKPITSTVEEANQLIEEALKRQRILQVGHLERFNAAFVEFSKLIRKPVLFEALRVSPFLGRGVDVDVTLDLMIHDIDIILSLVDSEVVSIEARGARAVTPNIDFVHSWLGFDNGCAAVLAASRVSSDKMRTLKVFEPDNYRELDFQKHEILSYPASQGAIQREVQTVEPKEPLKEELLSFIHCIETRNKPVVSGEEGKRALEIALKISEVVKHAIDNG